ncbi:MAG TPA: hypothetical protein VF659_24240 [Pyrinomonadaceae bacterium]|jgi:hypothetical protein
MGGGNKERKAENAAANTNYNAALTNAQAESPYEKRRRETAESIDKYVKSGDYRQPPNEAKVFFNFADVAARQRQRGVLADSRGQGVSAMGAGANPTVLALDKQHRDAELEEDAAREYQTTLSKVAASAAGELGDLDAADRARRLSVLGTTAGMKSSMYQADAQRRNWWDSLLGAAGQIGGGLAGNSAFINKMFKKGGRTTPYIGKTVLAGEEGAEIEQGDDGSVRIRGAEGPEVFSPDRPSTIIPADETRRLLGADDSGGAPEWLLNAAYNAAPGRKRRGAPVAGGAPAPATRPRRVGAPPAQSLEDLGIPADAQELPKTQAGGGLDESYVGYDGGDATRPRRAVITPEESRATVESLRVRKAAPAGDEAAAPPVAGHSPDDFSPFRVPMTRKTRALPPSGEEDTNDARVRDRIGAAGGYDDAGGGATETRPRWTSELNKETEHNLALREEAAHPHEKPHWFKRIAVPALLGALQGMGSGRGLAGAAGGAIVGGAAGAASPELLPRMKYGAQLAESDARLGRLREQRKDDLSARQLEANINWTSQRPGIERLKLSAAELGRQRQAVLANLRLLKGSKLDANNPQHAALLEQAQRVGFFIDPDSFNDAASNFAQFELVDPEHPEQKRRVLYNKATGELSDVGHSGYVAPVGEDELTEKQRRDEAARDRAFSATQDYRAQLLGLSSARLEEQMRNGLSGRAAREFATATRGLFERRRQVESQIADFRKRAAALLVNPADAERRIAELEKERGALTSQIDGARTSALGAMAGGPPPAAGSGSESSGSESSRPGRFAGQRMPRANLPAAAKTLGLSEQDAEALIRREGGIIY